MRIWSNQQEDSGSLHCLGNGLLCAYGQGPAIAQLFGPPYSAPSMLRLELPSAGAVSSVSTREPGTAVWRHTVTVGGARAAECIDFVPPGLPCLVRAMECAGEIAMTLRFEPCAEALPNGSSFSGAVAALLACVEAGAFIYGKYPTTSRQYLQVLGTAGVACRPVGPGDYELTFPAGRSSLLFVSGTDYPGVIEAAEWLLQIDREELLDSTRRWWRAFTCRRKDFASLIPPGFPWRARLLELIDSVSVLIRAQQGREGGVMAGHNFHMAYVRDQYGVFRCLLALGYDEEAKAILSFYWDVWRMHGRLQTAQGIGAYLFHRHENDTVEITGYLVLQAFDYLRETGDEAFIRAIAPMLLWAFDRQKEMLVNGMLPFNGDETYIAGGMLPRDVLNDGSAEATLLFVTGGRLLLDWAERQGLMGEGDLDGRRAALDDAGRRYGENFLKDGLLIANNPARLAGRQPPRFRHGVCQACGAFGWTERAEGGLYACPRCLCGPMPRPAERRVHVLKPVSLMPAYIGSPVIPREMLAAVVDGISREYEQTGRLPSSPEGDGTVGYDYGLLLYNLLETENPKSALIMENMLGIVDDADAWVEYYRDGKPFGTRCRPWESGINLQAAIAYALCWKDGK